MRRLTDVGRIANVGAILTKQAAGQKCNKAAKKLDIQNFYTIKNEKAYQSVNLQAISATMDCFDFAMLSDIALGTLFEPQGTQKGEKDVPHDAPEQFMAAFCEWYLYDNTKISIMHTILCTNKTSTETTVFTPSGPLEFMVIHVLGHYLRQKTETRSRS